MSYKFLLLDDVQIGIKAELEAQGHDVAVVDPYDKAEILEKIVDREVVIYRLFTSEFDAEILEKATKLRCLVRTGGGASKMDKGVLEKQGIRVFHTNGCNSYTAAEFIFASIMTLGRRIVEGDKIFRAGAYDRSKLWGNEITGAVFGIIGFGRMARHLVEFAKPFKMKIISYSPNLTDEEAAKWGVEAVSLEDLYKRSDYISIAFPGRQENVGMFNKETFAMMKDGVKLVNMIGMAVFNIDDTVEALKSGKIGGLMMERPSIDPSKPHPLFEFDNVVLAPMLGSHSIQGQMKCAREAVELALDWLDNNKITDRATIL